MVHWSLSYLKATGHSISAHCEEQSCQHSQDLDLDKLIEALGPDFVIPHQYDYFISRLRCSRCGGGKVGIIIRAPNGY